MNPRVEASGHLVRAPEETDFSLDRDGSWIDRDRGVARKLVRLGLVRLVEVAALGHAPGRAPRQGYQVIDIGHVAVRVGRALAARDANARALIDT